MLEVFRTRWKKLVIVPIAALALGTASGVALNRYLVHADGDCCAPGMPCCHPGAPCCAHHHARVALR